MPASPAGDSLSLIDHAKRLDQSGKTARIVEMLDQHNPMLDHIPFVQANGVDGHLTTVRTGLPRPVWRKLYKGVASTKSTTAQVTETMAQLADRSHVDVDLASRNGDVAGTRLNEARPHFEGMSQEMISTFLYGNSSSAPEEFLGLAPRFSSKSAANGANIVDAGGVGSVNTSIWLICWGVDTVHGLFPQGSMAGLRHKDLGVFDAYDEDGNPYQAYHDEWKWDAGLSLRDWRYVVRIANIDVSNLISGAGAANLTELMISATKRLPKGAIRNCRWYMSRTCESYLDIQRYRAVGAGGGITYANIDGEEKMMFRGRPIDTVDAILETEARVV